MSPPPSGVLLGFGGVFLFSLPFSDFFAGWPTRPGFVALYSLFDFFSTFFRFFGVNPELGMLEPLLFPDDSLFLFFFSVFLYSMMTSPAWRLPSVSYFR